MTCRYGRVSFIAILIDATLAAAALNTNSAWSDDRDRSLTVAPSCVTSKSRIPSQGRACDTLVAFFDCVVVEALS
jgi:predicted anti-sigma-YlaC factor YlaD